MKPLLRSACECALFYLDAARTRAVAPAAGAVLRVREELADLPQRPIDPGSVLDLLDRVASPATVINAAGRYFGFVQGGTVPAALAAAWLVSAWDQNAGLRVMSPAAAELEDITLAWVVDLLGLPSGTGGAVVTGATMANFTALAAARHALLARAGWDVEARGLFGAPELRVVVGDEVHASLLKALSMLGLGRERVTRVAVDEQGRLRADALPELDRRTIVCIQAGNVNTGAFDPAAAVCLRAREAGAWVHVDGAFGLWAAASPQYSHLTSGFEQADSWATDAHKWPNVGYDCGIALVREPAHVSAAMSLTAAYLTGGAEREPMYHTPECSRRARGVELWAALRSMGRDGIADLIERTCRHARRFAAGLSEQGYWILNEVVINQVLVSFGDATADVIRGVQEEGTCWCSGTVWQGKPAMRISVSSWATTEDDVERSIAAIAHAAEAAGADRAAGVRHLRGRN